MKRIGAVVVLLVTTLSLPALAQKAPPPPASGSADSNAVPASGDSSTDAKRAEARQRFKRGLQLFEEGNYEAARVELERAYQLAPSYKILYNIGLCYEQLGDYVQAQITLQNYLETGGIDITEERRAEVSKELAQIRPRIGKLTIHTNVAGVEALVDDTCSTDASSSSVSCTPLTGTTRVLLMNPGRRRVTFRKEGYLGQTQVVTIAGSDEAELIVTMKALPKANAEQKTNPYLVPTIAAGAVAVAGLTTTAVLGFLTHSASSDQDDRLNKLGVTHQELEDGRSKTRELASFTTGFGIGTGVALAVTGYFAVRLGLWKRTTASTTVGVNSVGITF